MSTRCASTSMIMSVTTATFLYGQSVPPQFQREYRTAVLQFGLSPNARLAITDPLPFTFQETQQRQHQNRAGKVFQELLQDYNMRDGFVAPHGHSLVVFWSEQRLSLEREARLVLAAASAAAIQRLKELMPRSKRIILSARELEALDYLSRGLRAPEIVKHMDVSVPTVHSFLNRVRRKLKATTLPQAAVIAVQRGLI